MPRDPARIKHTLNKIEEAWELNPDARFFQLLYNIFQTDDSLRELYNVEDWQVEYLLDDYLWEKKK